MKPRFTISETAHIDAPAATLYAIIADYRDGHPRILPKQLTDLRVVEGGVGAGTVITFQSRVFGAVRRFRATVTEPEPGRVLVETNSEPAPSVTTFIVDPTGDGGADVTISTEFEVARGGVLGTIERVLTERVIPGLYREELRRLEIEAARRSRSS